MTGADFMTWLLLFAVGVELALIRDELKGARQDAAEQKEARQRNRG